MNRKLIASELLKAAREMTADEGFNFSGGEKTPSDRAKRSLAITGMDTTTYYPEDTDLEIVVWELAGKQYGAAFAGKQNKPLWYYSFRSPSSLKSEIEQTISSRKSSLNYKKERMKERREFSHSLVEGDILYSSWGYDQTNVSWYQVTKVIGKMVEIREVGKKTVKSEPPQDYVVPLKDRFVGPPMKKVVSSGDSVRISSYASGYKWDGKPKYETTFGWGH
jgi:hypothetical protein